MTRKTTAAQRAAALLAALCLALGLALPVCAEGAADQPLFSGTNLETIQQEEKTADADNTAEDTPAPTATPETAESFDDTTPDADEPDTDDETTAEANEPATLELQAGEYPMMLASNIAVYDDAIPEQITIYFAVDKDYQDYYTVKIFAQKATDGVKDFTKDMSDTGRKTKDGRKIFSIDLNKNDDYPYGGFERILFQYWNGGTCTKRIIANGGDSADTDRKWITAAQINGKLFDGSLGNVTNKKDLTRWGNLGCAGSSLYFKNASASALANVTAVFYRNVNGTNEQIGTQSLGTVAAGTIAAAAARVPSDDAVIVQFTWTGGSSALYSFDGNSYDGATSFNLDEVSCYTYMDTNTAEWQNAGADLLTAGKTIYFDATLSAYEYAGDGGKAGNAMPTSKTDSDGKIYIFLKDASGNWDKPVMQKQPTDTSAGSRQLWAYTIPNGKTYTAVQFSAWPGADAGTTSATDDLTAVWSTAAMPPTLTQPCFFADDGDPTIYRASSLRGGYWGEANSVRDAESGKGGDVVKVSEKAFNEQSDVKYVHSTLYDYYTDYELNGLSRATMSEGYEKNQRNWVTFRQFDQAVSDYYKANGNVKYPLYTGHFQSGSHPDEAYPFSDVANGLGLTGWDSNNSNPFFSANNSVLDMKGSGTTGKTDSHLYAFTFLGLVNQNLGKDNALMLTPNSGDATVQEPHFNKEFLEGANSKKTKLGDVYEDVQFPFQKAKVFGDGVDYWYFDSAETTLYLKKNTDTASGVPYYLEKETTENDWHPQSMNTTSGGDSYGVSNVKGFFPFNESIVNEPHDTGVDYTDAYGKSQNKYDNLSPNRYNYGFGAKLDIDFSLTSDGTVTGTDKDGTTAEQQPIRFYFSGDDDVWVYIDGKLALDIGGAHGKVSGVLDFSDITSGNVKAYISNVKDNGDSKSSYDAYNNNKPVTTLSFRGNATSYYYSQDINVKDLNLTSGTHKLTMYYMERGMWESNMAVAYNFPDHNEFQVEKKVDLTGVNEVFWPFFQNTKLFTMNIRNLATHYDKYTGTTTTTPSVAVGSAFTAEVNNQTLAGSNKFEKGVAPDGTADDIKATTAHYYAYYDDTEGNYRENRYGKITLNNTVDISNKDYLTFYVYGISQHINNTNSNTGNLSLDGMYLLLVDANDKRMGCLAKTDSLAGKADSANLVNGQWGKVKLKLSELKKNEQAGFDEKSVKYILLGDSYERDIYFRGFLFSAQASAGTIGFAVKQEAIRDYGSAETGQLKNAAGAVYSSNKAEGMLAVDDDGEFSLQDGELVTFTDQFRRGSYISLREEANPDLYNTTWTVFENGTAVESMTGGSTVTGVNGSLSLKDQPGTRPDDRRIECYDEATKNDGYTQAAKPAFDADEQTGDNTLVFRSYKDPDDTNQFTKLKVQFVNKVKVGSLKITKRAAKGEEESLKDQKFTFKILFTNIGGAGLGQKEITQTVTCGETVEITGIPVGTRFRVIETNLPEGVHLKAVDEKNGGEIVLDGTAVRGTITETTGENAVEAIFTNTRRELIDIDLTKKWVDASGNALTDGLPDAIWVQLQRKFESEDTWKVVQTIKLTPQGYDQTWTYKFTGLDKYEPGKESNIYQYRVVEGTCDEGGNFTAVENSTITWNSWNYEITTESKVDTVTSADGIVKGNSGSITLTNTRQNPRYKLNITKQGVDGATSTPLEGVMFKLEKLDENGNYVEVATPTATTNGDGECSFADLEPGSYRLTETKTADGYSLLAEPIEFTLDAKGSCTLNGTKLDTVTGNAASGYSIALTVNNRKTFELPHTGADAPSLWLLLGLPALTAGLLALAFCYNKKGGRHS